MSKYVVATVKPWNVAAYSRWVGKLPGEWTLITDPDHLKVTTIEKIGPKYIFFPHWSWIVPADILTISKCVCFHMTALPYGRGGSPLQNLIDRGKRETKLSAFQMTEELDAGPVYLQHQLMLNGSAIEIYERCAELCYRMVKTIVEREPNPVDQQGEPVFFSRRTEDMSVIPEGLDITKLYDFIRMLDAETYPRAYLEYGQYRLTFSSAQKTANHTLKVEVEITSRDWNIE